ncbi:MAG: biotin carboxylase [Ruminococcaceae bacterium]|nr:biotin carboxylase [Oscillospiraceae bacterium]
MKETPQVKIPKRILGTLLNSAGAGVVPRQGLEYIAIGREKEINALVRDLENISLGMGAFRFVVGKYGSGKSFLMGLIRANAQEKGFVTADSDLSPERRFHGTQGQGLATFRELMRNLSCKSMPDSGALPAILGNWFTSLQMKGITEEKLLQNSPELSDFVQREIFRVCRTLQGNVNGFDFAKVLVAYFNAYTSGNDAMLEDALRWLRGEFTGKMQARASLLSINSVIDDQNWYEYLKLYAVFFRLIGYKGFLVLIDECVNLYKIPNRVSRENNYEKILSMFNDTMQGKAEGLGIILGATPQLIEDPRRGLFSYEALKSRLVPGKFIPDGKQNLLSPLIYLQRLTDNEIFALCKRLLSLHSSYYGYAPRIGDDEILAFLKVAFGKMGADEMITPREITRDFLNILDIMFTDPDASFNELIGKTEFVSESKKDEDDDFFNLDEIQI